MVLAGRQETQRARGGDLLGVPEDQQGNIRELVGDVLEAGIVGGVGIEVIIEPAGVAVGALPPAVGVLLRVVLLVLVVPRPFPWGGARGEEGRGAREVQEGRRKQGVGEGGRGGNVDIEARVVVVVVVVVGGGGVVGGVSALLSLSVVELQLPNGEDCSRSRPSTVVAGSSSPGRKSKTWGSHRVSIYSGPGSRSDADTSTVIIRDTADAGGERRGEEGEGGEGGGGEGSDSGSFAASRSRLRLSRAVSCCAASSR